MPRSARRARPSLDAAFVPAVFRLHPTDVPLIPRTFAALHIIKRARPARRTFDEGDMSPRDLRARPVVIRPAELVVALGACAAGVQWDRIDSPREGRWPAASAGGARLPAPQSNGDSQ